jgi:hypothetical protein
VLHIADNTETAPIVVGETQVDRAIWREDGQMLGLGRLGSDGTLDVRLIPRTSGSPQQLVELPLRPPSGYGAAWDLAHARLLVASPAPAGGIDYWLAMLGLEDQS